MPVRLRNDAEHSRQPETRAAAHFLRGEKWLEDVRLHLGWYAGAGVADSELRVKAGRQYALTRRHVAAAAIHQSRLDRQRSTRRHRVARVDGEIHDHLFELPRI